MSINSYNSSSPAGFSPSMSIPSGAKGRPGTPYTNIPLTPITPESDLEQGATDGIVAKLLADREAEDRAAADSEVARLTQNATRTQKLTAEPLQRTNNHTHTPAKEIIIPGFADLYDHGDRKERAAEEASPANVRPLPNISVGDEDSEKNVKVTKAQQNILVRSPVSGEYVTQKEANQRQANRELHRNATIQQIANEFDRANYGAPPQPHRFTFSNFDISQSRWNSQRFHSQGDSLLIQYDRLRDIPDETMPSPERHIYFGIKLTLPDTNPDG